MRCVYVYESRKTCVYEEKNLWSAKVLFQIKTSLRKLNYNKEKTILLLWNEYIFDTLLKASYVLMCLVFN